MANTGWQISRSILAVASSDNSKLLDRNGLECNQLSVDGVPVSSAGLKQAAKVLASVNVSTEMPVGKSKTYSQLYDIVGTYTVTTAGVSPSNLIYQDGVVVGRYKGGNGDICEISNIVVFSSTPSSTQLPGAANPSADIEFTIASTVGVVLTEWSITSAPSWLTATKVSQTILKISEYQVNSTSSSRLGNIVLTQSSSGETLSVTVTQQPNLIVNNGTITVDSLDQVVYVDFEFPVTTGVTVQGRVHHSDGSSNNITLNVLSGWNQSTNVPYTNEIISILNTTVTPSSDSTYSYVVAPYNP